MNRHNLFRAFNQMRRMARDGYFESGRLNRALGIAQAREPRLYHTTVEDCDCMDKECRRFVPVTCKHQLAELMRKIAATLAE